VVLNYYRDIYNTVIYRELIRGNQKATRSQVYRYDPRRGMGPCKRYKIAKIYEIRKDHLSVKTWRINT
jgi:hypothetical protein